MKKLQIIFEEEETPQEKKAPVKENTKKVQRKPKMDRKKPGKTISPIFQEQNIGEKIEEKREKFFDESDDFMVQYMIEEPSYESLQLPKPEEFEDPELKMRFHELSDEFPGAKGTRKMAIYIQAKILLSGGYVSHVKVKKPKGGKTKGQDNTNIFLSNKELSPLLLKIMRKHGMGYYENLLWSLLAEPEVQQKMVPGIHPDSFVELVKRRCYDVFSVFEGAQIMQDDQKDPRFWRLVI